MELNVVEENRDENLSLIIRNVRVIDPRQGSDEIRDFVVAHGVIQGPDAQADGLPEMDGTGMIVAPGFWDVHVHFRDPGNPAAEIRRTGAEAAAAGGFTHVVTMPNTTPAGDSVAWLREQIEDESFPVQIMPSACVTAGRQGKALADLAALEAGQASCFTDDGNMVVSDELMREAMKQACKFGLPIMDHAVVPSIAGPGVIRDCPAARELGLPIFPPEAEIEAVRRDIRLCGETGCATHIQHISCAETIQLIREAQAKGLPVTGEATPHHIAIAAEEIPGDEPSFKMNPPLGNRADVEAIRQGVLDGTLSLFATDHAPHTAEAKAKGFLKAPFGIVGLETAIGVTWKVMVETCGMPIPQWVAHWTKGPAALLGKPLLGLRPGVKADFVLIDTKQAWTVDPESCKTRSRNTPFAGWTLPVRAVLTAFRGKATSNLVADRILKPCTCGRNCGCCQNREK